jgi:hypothetical protein
MARARVVQPNMGVTNISETRRLSRRQLLKVGGLASLTALLGLPRTLRHAWGSIESRRASRWGDPSTWGGRLPRKSDLVIISHRVVLDRRVRVAGVIIRPGGHLLFHPKRRATLASTGNVVVLGRLTMQTKRPGSVHRLVFKGIRESRFKGGGHHLVPSDVGLWVMERGRLRLEGAPKLAWTRAVGPIESGMSSIELQDDPVGWAVGDTLAITPTVSPSKGSHVAYDEATITSIAGRTIALSTPVSVPHPSVELRQGTVATAEVLNLTRTVRIEGTPRGRPHILIHSRKPQRITNVQIQHVGPRKKKGQDTMPVPGRYGLHFHHCRDGSRGSVVQGVVVRDAGNHAFVPHRSHGVSFVDCISHNTVEDAYWWDDGDITNDTLWENCVASLVKVGSEPYARSGFLLGAGTGNVCRRCVAVGVESPSTGSGFQWPSKANQKPNVWVFEDCLAHNNVANGIFVWQNDPHHHLVSRFVAYYNGSFGVLHGAYSNRYEYVDLLLYGNLDGAIELRANTPNEGDHPYQGPIILRRVYADGAGLASWGVQSTDHNAPPGQSTLLEDCTFTGHLTAGIGITADKEPTQLALSGVSFAGNEFWLGDTAHPDTFILYQSLTIRPKDHPVGDFRPEWNAKVS